MTKFPKQYSHTSNLANLPQLVTNFKFTSLPAVEANPLGFGDEVNIYQTTTCTIHDMERRKMQLFENGQLVKTLIYSGMYEKETDPSTRAFVTRAIETNTLNKCCQKSISFASNVGKI